MLPLGVLLVGLATVSAQGCGTRNFKASRIVNGIDAVEGQFPWQLSLEYFNFDLDEWRHTCGASLISPNWVVTAAHCLGREDTVPYRIIAGQLNRANRGPDVQIIDLEYADFTLHPNWFPLPPFPGDIAVGRLPQPADLSNPNINTICLPSSTESNDYAGNPDCEISGWGVLQFGQPDPPDQLQWTPTNVLTRASCRQFNPLTGNAQVCVRDPPSGGCSGDSGGPISCGVGGRYELVGAASFVVGECNTDFPTYYANVPGYRDWITEITGLTV